MADVYVLASPAPTLYVYPSALHPASTGGGSSSPAGAPRRLPQHFRASGYLRVHVAASGVGTVSATGAARVTISAPLAGAGRITASGRGAVRTACRGRGSLHGQGKASVSAVPRLVLGDVRHIGLHPALLDLLLDDWDDE